MKNNSKAAAKRTQVVMSEKSKVFVSKKTVKTKSGKKITVNVYKANKNAKPIKTILHPLPPPTGVSTNGEVLSWGLGTPILPPHIVERNAKRDDERLAKKNRAVLVVSGAKPFVGSIRRSFTGANRNNVV